MQEVSEKNRELTIQLREIQKEKQSLAKEFNSLRRVYDSLRVERGAQNSTEGTLQVINNRVVHLNSNVAM